MRCIVRVEIQYELWNIARSSIIKINENLFSLQPNDLHIFILVMNYL